MSLYEDAERLSLLLEPINDGMCDVCHAFGVTVEHAPDCATRSWPSILAALRSSLESGPTTSVVDGDHSIPLD